MRQHLSHVKRDAGGSAMTIRRGIIAAASVLGCLFSPLLLEAGSDLAIPKPTDVLLPPPPPPVLEASVVNLTIGKSLRDVSEAINSSIPVHHRHEQEWIPGQKPLNGMPFEYQYYLWRGPVQFTINDDRLITAFPDVRYRVRVRQQEPNGNIRTAECGYGIDAHMRMSIEAASEIAWTDQWIASLKTQFGGPRFGEPCRLDPIAFDMTDILTGWFDERLPALASTIDQSFHKQMEAKRRAQIIWDTLQEPVELKPETWLMYRPQNPRAGALTLDRDQTVQTIVSMAFDPIIVFGAKPKVEHIPLPVLRSGPPGQEGFHLAVPLLIPYEKLNRQLERSLVGQEIDPPVGSTIRITGVRTYGSGDKLISEVTLSGGMNGNFYMQGRPAIAADGHTFELQNFDFTLETSNILGKFANRVMYETIRDNVLQNTRIEVGDRIEWLRRQVERQMNRELSPGIRLEGAVSKLEPRGVYPVRGGVEAQFAMDGTLHLAIQ